MIGENRGSRTLLMCRGGKEVFGLFLDRYDVFYLSRAPAVHLLGGRPVFPEVSARTPEEVLARHDANSAFRHSQPRKLWHIPRYDLEVAKQTF